MITLNFLGLLDRFISKYDIHEINPIESLITKIISGDQSDNIGSVWSVVKTERKEELEQQAHKQFIMNILLNL
jgi:hypothetical protein